MIRILLSSLCLLVLSFVPTSAQVFTGADVALNNPEKYFLGQKVYLLTNHSGRTSDGLLTANRFIDNPMIDLKGLLVPEHGFYTTVRAGNAVLDEDWRGIPVISLYGRTRKPTPDILQGCDIVCIDIQDIGVRSYTYVSTVFETMQACAENGKKVVVLDRPNPIGGMIVDGSVPDEGVSNFVCRIPVPYLHGCTVGELAQMINGEGWLGDGLKADLTVVPMDGWERWMHWEDTKLMWFPTSPHIPTPDAVRGIAATGIFGELGLLSIGIGSMSPFQYIGHPDLGELEGADYYNMDGIRYFKSRYQPFYGMYNGKDVPGYILRFPDGEQGAYFSSGVKFMAFLDSEYPGLLDFSNLKKNSEDMFKKVTGTSDYLEMFKSGDFERLEDKLQQGVLDFVQMREKYLLYR